MFFQYALASLVLATSLSVKANIIDDPDLSSPEVLEWAAAAAKRCSFSEHPVIYGQDFEQMDVSEGEEKFQEMYHSPKRLQGRFYFENGEFKGHHTPARKTFAIPLRFLYSTKKHIESALERGYVQWVFFPDMGHTHLFVDLEDYQKTSSMPSHEQISQFIRSPRTKFLYHTFEKFKAFDEDKQLLTNMWVQWRYYTRNIVGDNRGLGHLEIHKDLEPNSNTVRNAEGYRYYYGLNLSANKNGCFSYKHQGQTYYFDISFEDLPYYP